MGKLSDQQIHEIIRKATLLQKFAKGTSTSNKGKNTPLDELFAMTDDMDLDRKVVLEAYHETLGIPVHDPVIVDNNDFGSTEVLGYATGQVDTELMSELKARIEYHFNTMGKTSHRRGKMVWKAKPTGLSRLIASSNSPEVELKEEGSGTRVKVKQSLKTLNKLYIPSVLGSVAGFMMIAGVVFGQTGNDTAPVLIFGSLFVMFSMLFARFVNGRKEKRKKGLTDLVEVLQQSIERRSIAEAELASVPDAAPESLPDKQQHSIEIPDQENKSEQDEVGAGSKEGIRS